MTQIPKEVRVIAKRMCLEPIRLSDLIHRVDNDDDDESLSLWTPTLISVMVLTLEVCYWFILL